MSKDKKISVIHDFKIYICEKHKIKYHGKECPDCRDERMRKKEVK